MGKRRVYLVRHADVSYADAAGQPVANHDAVPLTEEGRGQAKAAQRLLASVPLDRAVVSGLPRTIETAAIILNGRTLRFEIQEALQDIRPGRPEDLPPERRTEEFKRALHRPVTAEDRFLAGETWGAHQARVLPCFRAIVSDPAWRHLLVVGHGGTNRVILLDALGATLASIGRIEQDAACVNVIDVEDDGRLLVRLLNHTPHDPSKETLIESTMERLFRTFRPLL